jgi:hypothetical protein
MGYCPLEDIEFLGSRCRVESCMYNVEGVCSESKLRSLSEDSTLRANKIGEVLNIDVATMQQGIRDIMEVENTRRYFTFILGKSILEMKLKDIETLRNSSSKYKDWVHFRGTKPTFQRVVYWVEHIATKL